VACAQALTGCFARRMGLLPVISSSTPGQPASCGAAQLARHPDFLQHMLRPELKRHGGRLSKTVSVPAAAPHPRGSGGCLSQADRFRAVAAIEVAHSVDEAFG
jgi:hypothetical protein